MRPVAEAALRAGLVDPYALAEMMRWGIVPRDANDEPYENADEAVQAIDEALISEDQVQLKKTDLDLLRTYLHEENQRKGRLVVVDPTTNERANRTITFSRVPGNRYVIPWMSNNTFELLVNCESYLSFKEDEADDKPKRVYFNNAEEIFFGDVKAFMVLEVDRVE